MNKLEILDVVAKAGGRVSYGFTKVSINNCFLSVEHAGNMGNSINVHVDNNLKNMRLPPVGELRKLPHNVTEWGSPDYQWRMTIDLRS